MRKISFLILTLIFFSPNLVLAQYSPIPTDKNIYYYSATCPHCRNVDSFFRQYGIVEKFNIIKKEVSQNPVNAKEFYDLCLSKNIPPEEMGVPYLHFEGQCFSGETEIINFFKSKMGIDDVSSKSQKSNLTVSANKLTLPAVFIAALADSINPCAFSVIIFLMLSLLTVSNKKRALKIGLIYIITVYLVYLLAGLGFLATLQQFSIISKYIMYVAAILAIIAGLINVKDFFWYGKGFSLAIPASKKPIIDKYIKYGSIPAAIILGFLVALFELPCTGGFYLAILALLATQTTFWIGFSYLIFYNLIFVFPLLIILILIYKGISPQKLEQLRTTKRKWLRLIMGLVLIFLGLSMIFIFK